MRFKKSIKSIIRTEVVPHPVRVTVTPSPMNPEPAGTALTVVLVAMVELTMTKAMSLARLFWL